MKKRMLAGLIFALLLMLMAVPGLCRTIKVDANEFAVDEDGWYDSMEFVAVYLDTFDRLPDNYLTKKEAQALGWVSKKGNLWDVANGCSIGGDRFGNYEGLLPDKKGRKWTECDIDFEGDYRNGKRIVFSNDGLIYYTDDHYESFDEIEVVYEAAKAASASQLTNKNDDYDSYADEEEYGAADLALDLLDLFIGM